MLHRSSSVHLRQNRDERVTPVPSCFIITVLLISPHLVEDPVLVYLCFNM